MSISVNLLVENLSKRVIYVNNIENKTKLRFCLQDMGGGKSTSF